LKNETKENNKKNPFSSLKLKDISKIEKMIDMRQFRKNNNNELEIKEPDTITLTNKNLHKEPVFLMMNKSKENIKEQKNKKISNNKQNKNIRNSIFSKSKTKNKDFNMKKSDNKNISLFSRNKQGLFNKNVEKINDKKQKPEEKTHETVKKEIKEIKINEKNQKTLENIKNKNNNKSKTINENSHTDKKKDLNKSKKQKFNFSKLPRIKLSSKKQREKIKIEKEKKKKETEDKELKDIESKKTTIELRKKKKEIHKEEMKKQKQDDDIEKIKKDRKKKDEEIKKPEEDNKKQDKKNHEISIDEGIEIEKDKGITKDLKFKKQDKPLGNEKHTEKELLNIQNSITEEKPSIEPKDTNIPPKMRATKKIEKDYFERKRILRKRFERQQKKQTFYNNISKNKLKEISKEPEKLDDGQSISEPKVINIEALKYKKLEELGYTNNETWKEIECYPLIDQFSYALVINDNETLDKIYVLLEVELTKEENKSFDFIKDVLGVTKLNSDEFESLGKNKYLVKKVDEIVKDYSLNINQYTMKKIIYLLEKQLLGLDKLEPLMKDTNIEDISCDGSDVPIFIYHRKHGSLKSNIRFEDEDELSGYVVKLSQKCGKHISIAKPMLDATMPDGSRIQMTLSTEVTTKGSTFTIRKFKENPFSPADLIEFNTMSSEMLAFLWMAVENGINALIAGGTASGKTSTLNALALFIPSGSKIVSIEETREINLPHSNWIPGVARVGFGEIVEGKIAGEIDTYELMKAALRQRPEYILVGEIRGREAYVLFQAMSTGHTTYSTVHADSAKSLVHRLEGKPIEIPRIMLQALDIVCIQTISRVKDKRARRCKQIIEIIDIDPSTKEILTNEIFHWDPVEDKFHYSGKSYVLERIRADKNFSREEMTIELKKRASLMEWVQKKNIKEFNEVAAIAANYIENPMTIMKKVEEEK
jgi:flagellar protein FlaI